MKYLFLVTIFSFSFSVFSQESSHTMNMAFIDSTSKSMNFIDETSDYLIRENIPVMLIGDADTAEKLREKYKGLKIGVAPKPRSLLKLLFVELQIKRLPAVIEQDKLWKAGEKKR